MSVIHKKTKNRVIHYKNRVLKMSNEWFQVGLKEAVKLIFRSDRLRRGNTLVG